MRKLLKSSRSLSVLAVVLSAASTALAWTTFPRCWVVNCKDYCNGTACIACVQAMCGNNEGTEQQMLWWCDNKYQPSPCITAP